MSKGDYFPPNQAESVSALPHALAMASQRPVLRVWLVDDNAALRDLFGQLLSQEPGIRCTRRFPSAETVLATLAEERPPDVILLDINLSGQSGLSAIQPIRKLAPAVKVLMLTMFSNSHYEAEAFRAGASGFLLKSYEIEEIVKLIHGAHRNPGAPDLFPHMALLKEMGLEARIDAAGARGPRKRFGVVGALRQLWGQRQRVKAGG